MIREELKPISEFAIEQRVFNQKVGQTLYGSDGQGGMKHVLHTQDGRIDNLERNVSEGVGRRTVLTILGGGALGAFVREVITLISRKG
jgi:hypothetical protein